MTVFWLAHFQVIRASEEEGVVQDELRAEPEIAEIFETFLDFRSPDGADRSTKVQAFDYFGTLDTNGHFEGKGVITIPPLANQVPPGQSTGPIRYEAERAEKTFIEFLSPLHFSDPQLGLGKDGRGQRGRDSRLLSPRSLGGKSLDSV